MRERDKVLVAILGTAIVIGGIFFASNLYDGGTRIREAANNINIAGTNGREKALLDSLAASTDPVDTRSLLYSDVELLDLPIYPEAWVDRNFSPSERANKLISGDVSDPDNDNLSNKEEYFYGSNPKEAYSLCVFAGEGCNKPNDAEAVNQGISPLTGLELITPGKFTIKKQEFAIFDRIEDSFETASREGVDYPTLYQLSRQIDLSNQLESIDILEQEDTRDNFINYINIRISIIEDFSQDNELTNFIEIYQTSELPELEKTKEKYIDLEQRMLNTFAPKRYNKAHKAYIFLFQKFQDLIDLRIEGISSSTSETEEFKKRSQDQATELVWAFRAVNELEEEIKEFEDEEE